MKPRKDRMEPVNLGVTVDPDSPTPKVRQIEEQIRDQIANGQLKPGAKLPSMRNLAHQLGVSVGIAKQALNTLTSEDYLRSEDKIGVFVSNKKHTRDIALVLVSVELEQIARIVRGVRTNMPRNHRLVIEAAAGDYDSQIRLFKDIQNTNIEGILIPPPAIQRYAEQINAHMTPEIPCVQITMELAGLQADSSVLDGFESGLMAVNYLIEKGHSEIGLVASDADAYTFQQCNLGMSEALQKIGKDLADIPTVKTQASDLNADAPYLAGQKAAERLIKDNPQLTAIIGANAHLTLGASMALKEAGLSIPEDISLLSMGIDLPTFEYMSPPITVVDEPISKICRRGIELLINRIENPDTPLQSVHFPPVLRERESVKDLQAG